MGIIRENRHADSYCYAAAAGVGFHLHSVELVARGLLGFTRDGT
jgi:hypothetical protein